ncbi:unnamed protein product, partial [Oppiella nova]
IIAIISFILIYIFLSSLNTNSWTDLKTKNGTNGNTGDGSGGESHDKPMSHQTIQRMLMNEKYFQITDCGLPTDSVYPQYMVFEPLPINLYQNWTMNWRLIFRNPMQWTTQMDVEVEKILFGLQWLKIKIPCVMEYFGSCSFNFCKMWQIHWDEQLCAYIQQNYNMSCQCPDTFALDVLDFNDLHYMPIVDRIMKYFSWFAAGWYNVNVRLFDKVTKQQYLCVKTHFNIDVTHDDEDED